MTFYSPSTSGFAQTRKGQSWALTSWANWERSTGASYGRPAKPIKAPLRVDGSPPDRSLHSRPASLSPGTGPETVPSEQSASWSWRSGPQASRTAALSVPFLSGFSELYTPRNDSTRSNPRRCAP
ncbi:hypothetical protein chiPu_0028863 [Chiloscyllium punctatum]|uniref:Uncharacterized protein n=1 Tax=Chiloscyllium punctatum TaxID=137246 RepID=A0A401TQX1_CHIPU|nr:hypothetical protein [Chiloscyllium punctatum]